MLKFLSCQYKSNVPDAGAFLCVFDDTLPSSTNPAWLNFLPGLFHRKFNILLDLATWFLVTPGVPQCISQLLKVAAFAFWYAL